MAYVTPALYGDDKGGLPAQCFTLIANTPHLALDTSPAPPVATELMVLRSRFKAFYTSYS